MEQQSLLLPHCLCKLSKLESRDGAAQILLPHWLYKFSGVQRWSSTDIAATLALQFSKLDSRDGAAQTIAATLSLQTLQAGV